MQDLRTDMLKYIHMKIKILFLDVDGVLNSDEYFRSQDYQNARNRNEDRFLCSINKQNVQVLNRIIEQTSAKIVVSSTWRYHKTPEQMQDILRSRGFIGDVIGRTPMFPIESDHSISSELGINMSALYDRGLEIRQWLIENQDIVDRFAIVDDSWEMLTVKEFFVKTSYRHGLRDEDAEKIIALLNG